MNNTVHLAVVAHHDGLVTVYKREDLTMFPLVDDGDVAYSGESLSAAYHVVGALVVRAEGRQRRWRDLFGH